MKIVYEKEFANQAYIEITIHQQYRYGIEDTNKALKNLGVKIKDEDGVVKVYER